MKSATLLLRPALTFKNYAYIIYDMMCGKSIFWQNLVQPCFFHIRQKFKVTTTKTCMNFAHSQGIIFFVFFIFLYLQVSL